MRPALLLPPVFLLLAACSGGGGGNADLPEQGKPLLAAMPAPYDHADVDHGREVFNACRACHTIAPGAASGSSGPNLHDAWGARAATRAGFTYSEALKATGWTWDAARLETWLSDPQKALPGTKMTFTGLADANDRRDVIAYLRLVAADAAP